MRTGATRVGIIMPNLHGQDAAEMARRAFLRDLGARLVQVRIRTILTDNGKEFTDRLLFGRRKARATGAPRVRTRSCTALELNTA